MQLLPKWLNLRFFVQSCALAAASILLYAASASAAETVILKYQSTTARLPLSDVEDFATDGEISEALEAFLNQTPLSLEIMATLLADEIPDTGIPLGPTDIDFLLFQLNKLVGEPLERDNLEPLRQALYSAYLDGSMSVLELVKRYRASEVRLDLGRLSRVHRDLDLFVRRLSSVFNLFEALLPDLVCECENEATTSQVPLPKSTGSASNFLMNAVASESLPSKSSCDGGQQLTVALKTRVDDEMMVLLREKSSFPGVTRISQNDPNYAPPRIAEHTVFAFGLLTFSFSIAELTTFAETGEVPSSWRFSLRLANVEPEDLQRVLTSEIELELGFLDRTLNNLLGEYALFQLGRIISTPSGRANISALRSALILSTANDGKVTLLEFLQNFPAQKVILKGKPLIQLGRSLGERGAVLTITGNLEDLLVEIQKAIASEICDCDNGDR